MFAFMLKSLVLRGSVLRDGLAVGSRLGFGAKASPESPEIVKSRRHPALGCRVPDLQPELNPPVDYSTEGFMPGAGRSRRQSGSRLLTFWHPRLHATPVRIRGLVGR